MSAPSRASGSGGVSDVPDNDPDFGEDAEEVVRFWCERAGIPYLGRADIGHDSANKVVPFGLLLSRSGASSSTKKRSLRAEMEAIRPRTPLPRPRFALYPRCRISQGGQYGRR